MKASFFWKGIQQFNYYNKTSKETNQRYSGAATESHTGILSFFVKIPKKIFLKEFIFGNAVCYLKKELLRDF